MGAGASTQSAGASQHVFEASGARTTFSGDLVTQLQDSTGSDSTRSAALEQRIQARITEHLEKLAASESDRINSLVESAGSEPQSESQQSPEDSSSDDTSSQDSSIFQKLTGSSSSSSQEDKSSSLSNTSVSKEITNLKKKLEGRKGVKEADGGVVKAKEELVACLRVNDRRPLDCWREKEAFKREVARMERGFVERTVR